MMFTNDGYREPRPQQTDYLKHLSKKWCFNHIHAANLPTGYGKSFISRAIQKAIGPKCMIVTVSNQLMDQFIETYPEVNFIKGRQHYDDPQDYRHAYEKSTKLPSVANPLSYYYGCITGRITPPEVLIVDEAHKLYDTMFLAAHSDFNVKQLNIPTFKNSFELGKWVLQQRDLFHSKLSTLHKLDTNRSSQFLNLFDKISLLSEMVEVGCHTFTFDYTYSKDKSGRAQKVLRITPIELTKELFWPFMNAKKLILMSGTFTRFDLKFYDRNADYYTGEYLSDPEHRLIRYRPIHPNVRKCPITISRQIMKLWNEHNRVNTVVHVTYDMAKKLKPLLPEAITHSKATKDKAIERFKTDGGLFLASGCAEGIDLPDNECRLIIIPNLQYPNLGDEAVQKRRAMKEGAIRYALGTMMSTVQQIGRGTRHSTDSCVSYVLDPNFSLLYQQTYTHLPNDLNIDWKAS